MRVVFMGTPQFAVPALESLHQHHDVQLVVSQPDKRAGRGKKLAAPPVKELATKLGLPCVQPVSARDPAFATQLADYDAELAVVVAYGKILPLAVLEAFPRGCINIHGSILPKYRGAAPIQWAVIDGESETGVSIMQLDEGMDTGPVYLTKTLSIGMHDTTASLSQRLSVLGAEALIETLTGLESGELQAVPQDDSAATHARMLKKADGIVDWGVDHTHVHNLVRGVDPWPGAVTSLAGQSVKLFGTSPVDGAGQPGEVLSVDTDGLVVACSRGAVRIAELQLAGKKRLPAKSFAAGARVTVGSRFSNRDED